MALPVDLTRARFSALYQFSGTTTSQLFLSPNMKRAGAMFFNNSVSSMYIALAQTASTTLYTIKIPPAGYYELPFIYTYTGPISGIWDTATGTVQVTEVF